MMIRAINDENLILAGFDNVIGVDSVRPQGQFILDILTAHELVSALLFYRINNVNRCLIGILKFGHQSHDVLLLCRGEYLDSLQFFGVHNSESLRVLSSVSRNET